MINIKIKSTYVYAMYMYSNPEVEIVIHLHNVHQIKVIYVCNKIEILIKLFYRIVE